MLVLRSARDGVDAAVLVGGDRVRHLLLRLARIVAAPARRHVHGPHVLRIHLRRIAGEDADDTVLGREGDVAVPGEDDPDDLVVGAAEGGGREGEAQQLLDRRGTIAAHGVGVDVHLVALADDEAAGMVEDVVGAARCRGAFQRALVEVDERPGGRVDLAHTFGVRVAHHREPGGAVAVGVWHGELKERQRAGGQRDVLLAELCALDRPG